MIILSRNKISLLIYENTLSFKKYLFTVYRQNWIDSEQKNVSERYKG